MMASLFLLIHIGLLCIFARYQVTPMMWFNVGSVLFYIWILFVIHRGNYQTFVFGTFLEVCLHMGVAICCVGWEADFQICLIGICVLLFYAEYVGRSLKLKTVRSFLLAPLSMITYLAALIYTTVREPLYRLPDGLYAGLRIFWCLVVFLIALVILQIFVYVATRSQERLSDEAMHDRLTGLPNRYYMAAVFPEMMKENNWLAISDLDDFKQVNDTYGHNCGDYILKTVAVILREMEGVEVCRWGGEEFLMIGTEKSVQQLEEARKRIAAYPFEYGGTKIRMTTTIGMAQYRKGHSIDEWINAADQQLYQGKTAGKNRIVADRPL